MTTRTLGTLVDDHRLDYIRLRRFPSPGAGLQLDPPYRYAHLPLVAPTHPDVIPHWPERGYVSGRHPNVRSLVLPIDWEQLSESPAFQILLEEMRNGPLADLIPWPTFVARKSRVHATLCGNLPTDARLSPDMRAKLARIGPIRIELRGLFSGNLNTGRLYLRVYPEEQGGDNLLHLVQDIVGRPRSSLYLVGAFNLTDHLAPSQADWLINVLRVWWESPILSIELPALALLDARDDLVLDGEFVEWVPLSFQ